jgi:RNA polymerase sigma factor (sigma-70 family)
MGTKPTSVTIEHLLVHQDWLRRLARALVRDANEADDLVQETMLAALRSPPNMDIDTRNWLAVVLRNTLRTLKRSTKRRDLRERATARKEALPATVEALARASMQHELVKHVLELDEATREVVLLRFFADMPPREIALELDRPLITVKNGLQRGLAMLRERLDAKHGGREEWLAALVPFLGPEPLVGTAKVWIGAALLVLTGGVTWFVFGIDRAAHEGSLASLSTPLATPEQRDDAGHVRSKSNASSDAPPTAERTSASVATEPRVQVPFRDGDARPIRARFVDTDGAPIPGFRFRVADSERPRWSDATETVILAPNFWLEVSAEERRRLRESPEALAQFVATNFAEAAVGRALILGTPLVERTYVADADGEASLELVHGQRTLMADDPAQFVVVGFGRTRRDRLSNQWTYVVAPARTLHGRVLDAEGRSLPNAKLVIDFAEAFREELPFTLSDAPALEQCTAWTRDQGRFALDSVPRAPIRGLLLELEGGPVFVECTVSVAMLDLDRELVVTLPRAVERRPEHRTQPLVGRVLRPDGSPARHARVANSRKFSDVDAEGRFELETAGQDRLWAFERSYGYAEFTSAQDAQRTADGRGIEILLAHPIESIQGIVLDDHRMPVAGIEVQISQLTRVADMPSSVEAFLAGSNHMRIVADATGRFRIEGLLQHEYELSAGRGWQRSKAVVVSPSPAQVTLELQAAEHIARVRGRVLTLSGDPIAEPIVSVWPRDRSGTDSSVNFAGQGSPPAGPGEFELRDIVCPHASLVVGAYGYMPNTLQLEANAADDYFEVRLAAACRVRVSVSGTLQADHLCVRSASRAELEIRSTGIVTEGSSPTRLAADSGTFPSFQVSELAAEILLMRGEDIVARRDVTLNPDRVTRVEF